MLDFFGCEKEKMGYVPFISEKAGDAHFHQVNQLFSFPYGFKHGKVIEISDEEYKKILSFFNNKAEGCEQTVVRIPNNEINSYLMQENALHAMI